MKLQELSLSDLYGLRESLIAKYKYDIESSEKIEKIIENDPKNKPLLCINNEIERRETEIINEITAEQKKKDEVVDMGYVTLPRNHDDWVKEVANTITNMSDEIIDEIKNAKQPKHI